MSGVTAPVTPMGPRRPPWGRRVRRAWRRSWVYRFGGRARDVELMHRALGFAALGLVTLVPLLIVVAAAYPVRGEGFAGWLVDGLGVTGTPATTVRNLFSAPQRVLGTTSVFSVVAGVVFGISFSSCIQTGYERIWDLPPGRWHAVWRQLTWLAALTACLFVDVHSGSLLQHGWAEGTFRGLLTYATGTVLFWWGQHLLLAGRVSWRQLFPGAFFTALGLVGLRVVSSLVLAPLLASDALTYGAIGTVLLVQSWMIGAGVVVFGGALLGREFSAGRDPEQPLRDRRVSRSRPQPRRRQAG
ncbi:membrane protein [Streptacidiphilus sp. MAP12-16]|uniref:YhjD/YihY/BrkB family envelope integrity protein n=1 Tax=Streptacidiphilus sp. MAP12-16 TaxID=3156300 RepID=UPI00351564BC